MPANRNRLAAEVISLLVQAGKTVAVAESSTGGLIGHLLTEVAGSSAAFLGGVVAYHNDVKQRLLGVPPEILEQAGAVSEEAAKAMAEGVRRLLGADIGLAVSGIAGPTGATPTKPVGLHYVALAAEKELLCQRFLWSASRSENKRAAAEAALRLLHRYLEANPSSRCGPSRRGRPWPPARRSGLLSP